MESPERLISWWDAPHSLHKEEVAGMGDSTMKEGNKAEAVEILSYTCSTEANGF